MEKSIAMEETSGEKKRSWVWMETSWQVHERVDV